MKSFSRKELLQRLLWAVIGYFTSLYGVVNVDNIPVQLLH